MNLISLKTELRQELKLTPQLLQSMEVLQMNSQELLDYLGKISEENPTLELSEASELRSAYAELRQKASWLDAGTFGTSFAHEEDAPPEPGATDKELDSLSAFLCDQLERKRLPKPMLALCKYMAELVDEDGYLTQEDLDGLTEMKIPQTMVDQALDTIQSLEPAGVGARDLSECLVLQLSRRKDNVPYAMDIAARFLTELSRSLGSSPRSGVSAGRADPLRPAGCVHCGAGRGIAGAAERILSSKGHCEPLLQQYGQGE